MASALAERQRSYFGVPTVPRPTVAALGPPWPACFHHGCGCLWCLVGRHRSLTAAVALDHHALWLWTQGRVARFKLWPLRRLLALETPLEKATAPPLVRDCSGGLSGYLGSSPLLWETQRELVPRPYLLALRRGEAARFKEQPALAAALRPSSD